MWWKNMAGYEMVNADVILCLGLPFCVSVSWAPNLLLVCNSVDSISS